jgi:hypothetical protein
MTILTTTCWAVGTLCMCLAVYLGDRRAERRDRIGRR